MTDQSQKSGADSLQIQAGHDVIVGVTAEEVVSITRTEIAHGIERLTATAREVAEARVQALGDKIIGEFSTRPELIGAFADPDFQFSLRDAARIMASTGDEHTEQLLVDLLTNRAEEGSATRVRLATGQAIRAADKLSKEALNGLTAIWMLSFISSGATTFSEKLAGESENARTLLTSGLPPDNGWVSDLDVLNLARRQPLGGRGTYVDILAQRFGAFLVPGVDGEADQALLADAQRAAPELGSLIVEHPLKPGFFMLTPSDKEAVIAALPEGAAEEQAVKALIGKNGYGIQDNTARANFGVAITETAPLVTVRDWWSEVPAFDFTVAGDVVGFVNTRRYFSIANATSIADLLRMRTT
jgi:hypothetical protein